MPTPSKDYSLSGRALQVFKLLVERYIGEGYPVGSRALARDTALDVSPATIRNIMADLEDLGLIRSPHTSAGRVPTARGYRLFIDSLLTVQEISASEVERVQKDLSTEEGIPRLLEKTSALLSEVTRLASVVMLPRSEQRNLRQVEFLGLSENRVLAILVLNDNEVHNRVIHTERQYSPSELQQAGNYLSQAFVGRAISEVRELLLAEMSSTREEMNRMMQAVVDMGHKALDVPASESGYVWTGQTNLMGIDAWADIDKLRQLFEAFNQKCEILNLLDQALIAQGIQVFIGEESGCEILDDCSLVTSTYAAGGRVLGVLGIIGPTRMQYERVIPIVDLTAKLLGMALNSRH
ncbi:MAG: heat-inducible transcriptional repressor HrcA [Gammaproteobacteria bacterium]